MPASSRDYRKEIVNILADAVKDAQMPLGNLFLEVWVPHGASERKPFAAYVGPQGVLAFDYTKSPSSIRKLTPEQFVSWYVNKRIELKRYGDAHAELLTALDANAGVGFTLNKIAEEENAKIEELEKILAETKS